MLPYALAAGIRSPARLTATELRETLKAMLPEQKAEPARRATVPASRTRKEELIRMAMNIG
eukprot:11155402-Lingulodinium_polyedra.AAC.1